MRQRRAHPELIEASRRIYLASMDDTGLAKSSDIVDGIEKHLRDHPRLQDIKAQAHAAFQVIDRQMQPRISPQLEMFERDTFLALGNGDRVKAELATLVQYRQWWDIQQAAFTAASLAYAEKLARHTELLKLWLLHPEWNMGEVVRELTGG